jgi:TorA maturation chaperone TorD
MRDPGREQGRDPGLAEAFRSMGGASELARRLGISQPSVSAWSRVPAERVAAVEAASGVPRHRLRPDLYDENFSASDSDETDVARASEYAFLSTLLLRAPDKRLWKRIGGLRADPSPLGLAHAEVAELANRIKLEDAELEFFNIFIGIGRGELLPYASYYLTGFLHERPLARLREDLTALGVERVENMYEPEDHIGILFEVMSGLASGRLPAPAGSDRKIFEKHLKPWAGRFFFDLEHTKSAKFYRAVGRLGRSFMEIETEAFALGD